VDDQSTSSLDRESSPSARCTVAVGDLVAGKYQVERVIGEGGMGVVVSAMHVDLQERVAIKLMLPCLVGHPESAARFAREARATVKIKSEHVARLHDFGKLPDGSPFMVMEYLEGETLAAQLNRSDPIETSRAVDIVIQACAGVADAHRLGIIHRDLKPENLFLAETSDGRTVVKVLDFGISKADIATSPTTTEGGMGTPAYAAPEQLRCAGDAGPTADVWSLGVVLFELLTGRLPFEAASFAEMCAAVLTQRPPTPRSLVPTLSADLEAVILRCLEVSPDLRYPGTISLARALAPHASDEGRALVARLDFGRTSRVDHSRADIDLARLTGRDSKDTDPAPRGREPSLSGCSRDSAPPVASPERPVQRAFSAGRRVAATAAALAALAILGGAVVSESAEVAAAAAASTIEGSPSRPAASFVERDQPPPAQPAPEPPPQAEVPPPPPPQVEPPPPAAPYAVPAHGTPSPQSKQQRAAAIFRGFGGRK
jgi:serine/threonine protein kinase